MRLISCDIENFGRLHNEKFSFEKGLNSICEDNGWGKSTFASFVKAMFYGLEGDRKRSIDENDRKRYMPWQGGVFGGKLVFEMNGKNYEITRIFKDKENNDEFELRDKDTNIISNDYTSKIGEEIFGINSESFMRTIFIGQNSCETLATDDINAKIGNLTDNTNDLSNFDVANSKISSLLNSLNPTRATGSINKRKTEIAELERIVKDGIEITKSYEEYQSLIENEKNNYNSIKDELEKEKKRHLELSKIQSLQSARKDWERLKNDNDLSKAEYEREKSFFKNVPPSSEDIDIAENAVQALLEHKAVAKVSSLNDAEKEEYDALNSYFKDDIPHIDDIDEKISKISEFQKLRQDLSRDSMTQYEEERLNSLERLFKEDKVSINSMIGKWNERNTKKSTLPTNKAALNALKISMEKKKDNKGAVICLIIGILFLMTGAGLNFTLPSEYKYIVFLALGIGAFLLATGFILFSVKKNSKSIQNDFDEADELQMQIAEDMDYIDDATKEVKEYIEAHEKEYTEETASYTLQEIMSESFEYNNLKKKSEYAASADTSKRYKKLSDELLSYLNKYNIHCNEDMVSEELYSLRDSSKRFSELKIKKEKNDKTNQSISNFNTVISNFLSKYEFEMSDDLSSLISEIKEKSAATNRAIARYIECKNLLEDFESKNDIALLNSIPNDEDNESLVDIANSINSLGEKLEESRNRLSQYEKSVEEVLLKIDDLEENKIKLEELKAIQEKEMKMHECLLVAKQKLTSAKERITSKYTDPILSSFGTYFELIAGMSSDRFKIDANTNITIDELGKQREVHTMSLGYQDLIGICLRLSLIDAMYENETPVVIMDDPFTNLDDKKISATKEFLDYISKKYQIIYFTCSKARC